MRTRILPLSLGALLAALAALACSSSTTTPEDAGVDSSSGSSGSSGDSDGGGGPGISAGCKSYAEAKCAALFRCSPFEAAREFIDAAACAISYGSLCTQNEQFPGMQLTTPACVAGLGAQSCDAFRFGAPAEGCAGSQELKAACSTDAQCKSWHCNAPTGTCGSCDAPVEGSPCSREADCGFDTHCNKAQNACEAYAKLGEACLGRICAGEADCDSAANKCVARLTEGATCGNGAGSCRNDLMCDEATNKCIALKLVGKGEPVDSTKGIYCRGNNSSGETTCEPNGKYGEACTDQNRCMTGLVCANQLCTTTSASVYPCR